MKSIISIGIALAVALAGCSSPTPEQQAARQQAKADREAKTQADREAKATQKKVKAVKPKKEPERYEEEGKNGVAIWDYLNDWRQNSIKAEITYKGKIVPVVGHVTRVGKGITGKPTVTLTGSKTTDMVICYFATKEEIIDLAHDTAVVIEGVCTGMHTLADCKIVRKK